MHWLLRTIDLRPGERRPFVFGFLSFFLIFVAWYMIRPVREAMGIQRGADELPLLMVGTVVVSFLVNPLFSKLASTATRTKLARWVYRFLALNLLAFFLVFSVFDETLGITGARRENVGYLMYIWVSIFALLNNSVLWSLASEQFSAEASKRLFGLFGAACSLGAILGALVTRVIADTSSGDGVAWLPLRIDVMHVLWMAALLMWVASWTSSGMVQRSSQAAGGDREALSGSAWESALLVWRSPYLRGISGYILAYTVVGTFVYFMQGMIVDNLEGTVSEDTRRFADIDVATNIATLAIQVFGTRAIVKRLGVTACLGALPIFCALGMGWLFFFPSFIVLAVFQVGRRALSYGLVKPAREMLFTTVSRNEKYKAKNLIDLFVYRSGDTLGSVTWMRLDALGYGISRIAGLTIPLCFGWFFLAPYLGREFKRRSEAQAAEGEHSPPLP